MIFSYLLNMQSHPSWVCGLKHMPMGLYNKDWRSHPSWVCGLKPFLNAVAPYPAESHPSWVCGLKPLVGYDGSPPHRVTPFVGVWIETLKPRC